MSGHSKWSTIKRQKAVNDNAKGKEFSKLSKAIQVAIKTGGGPNPDSNYRLKVAVESAKQASMPKDTIQRAIAKASASSEQIDEITYEGFGPLGVQILIEAATDNKNRTSQEVKSLLDRAGGSLGGPGSVAFNFESKGILRIKKTGNTDEQILKLIDYGVEDVEDTGSEIEAYVHAQDLYKTKEKLEQGGINVFEAELTHIPLSLIEISQPSHAESLGKLVDSLEDLEDIQKVYINADFTKEAFQAINSQ